MFSTLIPFSTGKCKWCVEFLAIYFLTQNFHGKTLPLSVRSLGLDTLDKVMVVWSQFSMAEVQPKAKAFYRCSGFQKQCCDTGKSAE